VARTARVSLLFGPVSGPDRCATLALIHLDGTLMALEAPDFVFNDFSRELAGAREYLADFNKWALREAQGRPWWRRWPSILWLRRWSRRLREKFRRKGAARK